MTEANAGNDRDLVLTRLIDAPRHNVFRAWSEPELLMQWFAPKPWSTPKAEIDFRPGGANRITMADPDGNEFPNVGVYLEIVPDEKIVFTDAFGTDWTPQKPFMTVVLTFADEDGKTRYTARARHWTPEDRAAHEKMGFYDGWGQCADQLAEVARTL